MRFTGDIALEVTTLRVLIIVVLLPFTGLVTRFFKQKVDIKDLAKTHTWMSQEDSKRLL